MVLLGPHTMAEHQAMGVPTVMAEFYKIFRVNDEGPFLTLLPTTMPVGILNTAFRFEQDNAENALRQNTEHMTRDTGQAIVGGFPTGSVGFPYTTYDYISITRSSKSPDGGVCDQFLQ